MYVSSSFLLSAEQIQNKYLVEGKDVVIHYGLYNVGDNAATDVVLSEVGFGPNDFDVAGGQTVVKIDRIPPKANNTHVLVVRPKKFGYFNFTSAEVESQPQASTSRCYVMPHHNCLICRSSTSTTTWTKSRLAFPLTPARVSSFLSRTTRDNFLLTW